MARRRRRAGRIKQNIISDIGSAASGAINTVGGAISGAAQAAGPYVVPIIAGGAAIAATLAVNALGGGRGGGSAGGASTPPQEPPRIVYADRGGYSQSQPKKKKKRSLTTGGTLSVPSGFGKSLGDSEIRVTSSERELAAGIKKQTIIVKRIKRQMGIGAVGSSPGIGGVPVAGVQGTQPPGLRQAMSTDYEYLEERRRKKFMRAKL